MSATHNLSFEYKSLPIFLLIVNNAFPHSNTASYSICTHAFMHINTVFATMRHSLTRLSSSAPVEKPIIQKKDRVKCCYVNVCKWSTASVSVMVKWWQAFSRIAVDWEGKKTHLNRGFLLPLQPKPQMGVFIVHCPSHLSLQKIIRSESGNCPWCMHN